MIRKLRARVGEIPFLAYAFVMVYVIGFTAHPNDRFGYFMGVVVTGLVWLVDDFTTRDRRRRAGEQFAAAAHAWLEGRSDAGEWMAAQTAFDDDLRMLP